eukprot:TRINITY_DN4835_c0_g1_i4.p1 TRINITY_DN4835_c0_g1~~TRINITY_DN4835_c0_g1_i4.p1  ORF type:complete len:642 (+),score=126.32 TRINITY_DN4835_c0_g1_i4:182-1927(+)
MRKATESQVINFGQTPSQLFSKPHVAREPVSLTRIPLDFPFRYPVNYKPILAFKYEQVEVDGLNILRISPDGKLLHVTFQKEAGIMVFTHNLLGIIDQITAHAQSEASVRESASMLQSSAGGAHPLPSLTNKEIVGALPIHVLGPEWRVSAVNVSRNGLFLFTGGYWNCSLKAHLLENGMPIASVHGHCDVVTCIDVSPDNTSVVTGARDGTVTLWLTNMKKFDQNRLPPLINAENHIFGEHSQAVVDVSHDPICGVFASISKDKTCVVYSYHRRRYNRTIVLDQHFEPLRIRVCQSARILIYGLQNLVHTVLLYSVNGELINTASFGFAISCISTSVDKEFIFLGDIDGMLRIYSTSTLLLMQEIDCCRRILGPRSSRRLQARMLKKIMHSLESHAQDEDKSETKSEETPTHRSKKDSEHSLTQSISSGSAPPVSGGRTGVEAGLDDGKDIHDDDEEEEEEDEDEVEEEKTDRCAIQALEVSPNGHYFVSVMGDGRMLMYILPNMVGVSKFQVLFNTLEISVTKPIIPFPDDPAITARPPPPMFPALPLDLKAAGNTIVSGLGSLGNTIKKGFGGMFGKK